ncbi:MAG TPA: DUF2232 domain-containing protein [Sedimentibacter sp.]|nr:DUF2232 domain-containing protein [Sedimentibacter sp.]HOT21175.1 DUF2232 domain-containing protein [Sedimentibacter sp.]HQK54667.1 DUF2232 domain-containing protein [Sedimentibacter sp.]HQO72676.1 DUF2232 domain-containing protein [Sedimentibacter sp.]
MNRNLKTSNITESAMITGILVIIAYLSSFITLLMFFYPTPAIILGKRKGLKYSLLSLIASDLIISMLLGLQTGLVFLILYTPLALALTYGVCRNEEANKTILFGSAAYMISFVLYILLLNYIMGINFIERIAEIYEQSFETTRGLFNNIPDQLRTEQIEQYINDIEKMAPMMNYIVTNVFPAVLIVASVVTSYINYMVASKFAVRFSINVKQHEGIAYFSFPRNFMISMAGLLLLSFLLRLLNINVGIIQMNLFIIVFMAMLLQGVAVLKFFVDKSRMGKFARNLLLVFIVLMSINFSIAYAVIGLIDLTVNLRKINRAV